MDSNTNTGTDEVGRGSSSRRVQFADTPEITVIDCSKTQEEKNDLWYSPQEILFIQRDNRASLLAARSNSMDDSVDCVRGLERMMSKRVFQEKRAKRMSVVRHIVKEHKRQRMSGVHDPEVIKAFSMVCSKRERDNAVKVASADAAAAACMEQRTRKRLVDASSPIVLKPMQKKQCLYDLFCKPSPIKSRAPTTA